MAHYAGGMAEHPRDDVRWLTPAEKDGWTGLASLVLLLPGRFEAPLQREHGLTLFDYLTLSQLSEADGGRLRMSDLAYLANGSLSRLSNVVKRFVEDAAPTHVEAVRREALDHLTPDEQATLARIAERLRVRPQDHP